MSAQTIAVQRVAITCADGSLAVMQFVLDDQRGIKRDGTDAEIAAEIGKAALESPGVSWRRIAEEDLPTARDFRNAWRDTGAAIDHDIAKARSIHMERIRYARDEALRASDAAVMRAEEQGKRMDADALKTERQALRDLPATIAPSLAAALTVDELRALQPLEGVEV
jgi:hypothetical protein